MKRTWNSIVRFITLGVSCTIVLCSSASISAQEYQTEAYQLRDEGTELERYEGVLGAEISSGFRLVSFTINGLKNTPLKDIKNTIPVSIPRLGRTSVHPKGELKTLSQKQYISKGFQLLPVVWPRKQCSFPSFVFNHPMNGFKSQETHGSQLMALYANRNGLYLPTILGDNCGKSTDPSQYLFTFYSGEPARLTDVSIAKNDRTIYRERRLGFETGRIDFSWNGIDRATQELASPGKYYLSYTFEVQRFGRVSRFSKEVEFSHDPKWLK